MRKGDLCNEPDCEGWEQCPCRDWAKMEHDRSEACEAAFWEFDAYRKRIGERLAFKQAYNWALTMGQVPFEPSKQIATPDKAE